MSKPNIDDVLRGVNAAADLLDAGDDVVAALETTAGLLRRYRVQARKARNASTVMRPWHTWRRDRLADRLRERLGLMPTDPLP